MQPQIVTTAHVAGASVSAGTAVYSFMAHTLLFVQYGAGLVSLIVGTLTLASIIRKWLAKR